MSAIAAFPLQWPAGWKRTEPGWRKPGNFGKRVQRGSNSWKSLEDLTVSESVSRVLDELNRMGVHRDDVVISTNLKTRLDGLPRSDQKRPTDPGVAVYWREQVGPALCMAIDLYDKVEDNLAAVAATLDAMRAIQRHGGGVVLERAFTGFHALPAPAAETWASILGVPSNCTLAEAKAAYRQLAAIHHPDKPGGSAARMTAINAAWADAQEGLAP